MNLKIEKDKLPIIFGVLTLILFSTKPYILDLIEPGKSIGQVIGENAKDLIESLNGNEIESSNSKREIWSNIITISSFIMFALTIYFTSITLNKGGNKLFGIVGGLLSIVGLGVYLSHLAIGIIGFVVIAILVVAVVMFEGF